MHMCLFLMVAIGDHQAPPSSFDRYSWLFSFPMPFVKAEMWRNALLFGMLLFFWGRLYVPQTSLKILILLPLPHKWHYRSALPPPALCGAGDWSQGLAQPEQHSRHWAHPQPFVLPHSALSCSDRDSAHSRLDSNKLLSVLLAGFLVVKFPVNFF